MRLGKKITIGLVPTLLCLMSMLLVACGSNPAPGPGAGNPTPAPPSQQVFKYGFSLPDVNSLDPGVAPDQTSINAINLLFTGLVQLDDNLKVQDQLAASHSVSSDGLTYTFTLKPGLKFSDGTPLTSADVAYSIDRSLSPEVNNLSGVALTYLGLIQGAAARTAPNGPSIIGT